MGLAHGARRVDVPLPAEALPRDEAPTSRLGSPEETTQILLACRRGQEGDFDRLFTITYDELRKIARVQLQRLRPGVTLDTCGLIHEAYLKLAGRDTVPWRDRSHFFAIAARAMRQVIVDNAKKRCTRKHGAGVRHVRVEDLQVGVSSQAEVLVALDQALTRLADLDGRLIQVVECRFFAGYSPRETAEALGVSIRTVQREWKRAMAWLKEEISR